LNGKVTTEMTRKLTNKGREWGTGGLKNILT